MALIFSVGISPVYAFANLDQKDNPKQTFDIDAKSGILIDSSSGDIIYEKNIHEKLPPASITKIMVMLLAMEDLESKKITLEDKVVVSQNAAKMGGSQVYLEEGEVQTVQDLLKAIALRSANDASTALGEHLSGSLDLFIDRMNKRAKELGMKNTHFKNTTGLPDEEHYSTAYDVSVMSRELLKHPKINDWLSLWMGEIKVGKKKDVTQNLVNTNNLIKFYQGANGIKTGFTNDAGFCLSASAKRGNLSLISVILGCNTAQVRFNETKKLLDYGFAMYDSVTVNKKGDLIKKLPVAKGNIKETSIVTQDSLNILIKKVKIKIYKKK
ncbi:D-alanyl-D-alanine carboxypeptidase DacF [Gottschalkia acidurici 9a]|uniref:D-alanyl-D-alanine carboxypeptidase DacF n=2 Tax=Clostridium acidurici TaxID=1556 RepID=K0B058_GOTA9|nr:D-alanyl-D-alanine carboxypeptidase DacF [Gottschalkia acidurici 9a]